MEGQEENETKPLPQDSAGSAGIAIAEVAFDACVTKHTISHPFLAGDMQSLCGLNSSIGAFLGFSLSGFFVHLAGAKYI
ncbi:hypothetical protein CRYUN_Cryun34aG0099900 [Craigia yunnanensis]